MPDYERLDVQDRLHLDLEDRSVHMHVAAVLVFEAGPLLRECDGVDIEQLRAYLESRLHHLPRYRQRLARIPVEDHPIWVDDPEFNLDYHLRHTRLPLPGDERQLKRLAGRVFSQQLDRGKPLWELWVVEGLEGERVALILKVHHCIADGVASIQLLSALLTAEPQKQFEAPKTWLPRPLPGGARLLRDAVLHRAEAPLAALRSLAGALGEPRESLEQAREGLRSLWAAGRTQARPASETPLNRRIGSHRRFDWWACELDEVKRIKNALGGTVNDVVLAIVSGALSDFLESRGIARRQQRELEIRAACPVNLRPAHERTGPGNQVASLVVRLPVGEADASRRLAKIVEATRHAKRSHQQLAVEIARGLAEWSWPGLYAAFAKGAVESRTTNLIVTNVPGSPAPSYLLGARLLEAYPLVPLLRNQALGVACLSYAGAVYWGFNSDWDQVPDLHEFVLATDRGFHELADAAAHASG